MLKKIVAIQTPKNGFNRASLSKCFLIEFLLPTFVKTILVFWMRINRVI